LEDRNVFENVAFAQKAIEAPNRRIRSKVLQKLAVVGLVDKIRVNPKELSGGEQQRVAIARALVNEPAILLADEPTGNLDENNSWDIMKLLEEANEAGTTVIVVTHNMDIVRNMKRRTIRINDGVVTHDVKEGGMIYEV
jgi:cell division transport system ATP-binding protein